MALEEEVKKLTAQVERLVGAMVDNTAALGGTVAASSKSSDKPASSKGKPAADKAGTKAKGKDTITKDMMISALTDLKDEFGVDYAKEIVSDVGGSDKMGDIKPAKFAATYNAALEKIAELREEGGGEEEEEAEDDL